MQPCRSLVSHVYHAGSRNLVCVRAVPTSPESPEAHKCPTTHLLLPPSPLSSGWPSSRPQPTIYTVRALQVCHSPSSPWLENPLPLPPAAKSQTPPQPVGFTTAPISLLSSVAHLSTGSAGLPSPSSSVLDCRRPSFTSGLRSSGCAPSLHLCQAPPSLQLLLSPLSLRLHSSLPGPTSALVVWATSST